MPCSDTAARRSRRSGCTSRVPTSSTVCGATRTGRRRSCARCSRCSTTGGSPAPATSRSCPSTRASSTRRAHRSRANPDYFDPEKHRQARDRGRLQRRRHRRSACSARSRAATRTASRSCVKLNHNEFLTYPNSYDQIMFALGQAGVRAWAPWPSARRSTSARDESTRQIVEVSQAFEDAHELGMATVLWCYLRNTRSSQDGSRLPPRRRPDRPGQPPRRDDRGRHHQAEGARDGRRPGFARPRSSARPTRASTPS